MTRELARNNNIISDTVILNKNLKMILELRRIR